MAKVSEKSIHKEVEAWYKDHNAESTSCGMILGSSEDFSVCLLGSRQLIYDSVFSWLVQDKKAFREMSRVMRDVRRQIKTEEGEDGSRQD